MRTVLLGAVGVLVLLDLVGGLIAIAGDVNTVGEAWSGDARLAAPWPMILLQVATAAAAVRARRPWAVAAAAVLAALCLVSAISAFFDGSFAADELNGPETAFQVLLLAWTALAGGVAVVLARRLLRRPALS